MRTAIAPKGRLIWTNVRVDAYVTQVIPKNTCNSLTKDRYVWPQHSPSPSQLIRKDTAKNRANNTRDPEHARYGRDVDGTPPQGHREANDGHAAGEQASRSRAGDGPPDDQDLGIGRHGANDGSNWQTLSIAVIQLNGDKLSKMVKAAMKVYLTLK